MGKGKPPVEHQFQHGNKLGGRRKGSGNKNHLENLLDEKVVIGYDKIGRPRRRTWRTVINQQLLKKAAEGDLKAIKLVIEFELKRTALGANNFPVATEADYKELAEKQRLSEELVERMVGWLTLQAELKKLGALGYKDGKAFVPSWIGEAMREYRERHRDDGPLPG